MSGAPVQATHEELPVGRGGSGQLIPSGCPTHTRPTGRGMCSVTLWVPELSRGLLAPILWQTQEITLLSQKWPCQSRSTRKRVTAHRQRLQTHHHPERSCSISPKDKQSTRERLTLGHGPVKPRITVGNKVSAVPDRPGPHLYGPVSKASCTQSEAAAAVSDGPWPQQRALTVSPETLRSSGAIQSLPGPEVRRVCPRSSAY